MDTFIQSVTWLFWPFLVASNLKDIFAIWPIKQLSLAHRNLRDIDEFENKWFPIFSIIFFNKLNKTEQKSIY